MVTEKRLIDADALLAEFDKFANPMPNKSGYDFLCGVATAITEIEDAPTVDAVEVVHGHWTGKIICGGFAEEWGYKCSICGCTVSERSGLGVYQDRNQQLNYCPNCGAKMDGERRTNEG